MDVDTTQHAVVRLPIFFALQSQADRDLTELWIGRGIGAMENMRTESKTWVLREGDGGFQG